MTSYDIDRFWSKVNKFGDFHSLLNSPCWNWIAGVDGDNYGRFSYGGKAIGAHRFSYLLHHGKLDMLECVLHKCDNPICVNPEHLFTGTNQDNVKDRVLKGRSANGMKNGRNTHPEKTVRGERFWAAKLSEQQVRDIREIYKSEQGTTLKYLSCKFNIGISTLSSVINYHTWKHVK